MGADPIASERLWDLMYRHAIHGRKGATMLAISVVDCALWDLRGKAGWPAGASPAGRPGARDVPGLRQRAGVLA